MRLKREPTTTTITYKWRLGEVWGCEGMAGVVRGRSGKKWKGGGLGGVGKSGTVNIVEYFSPLDNNI